MVWRFFNSNLLANGRLFFCFAIIYCWLGREERKHKKMTSWDLRLVGISNPRWFKGGLGFEPLVLEGIGEPPKLHTSKAPTRLQVTNQRRKLNGGSLV